MKKKKMMNNRHFQTFPKITVAVYFTYFTEFETIIVYRRTRRVCWLSEKAYNICVREFSAVTFVWG